MRTLSTLLAAAVIAAFGFTNPVQALVETVDLWADGGDGGFKVGIVEVFDNGGGSFDVTYTTDNPWRLFEIHTEGDNDDNCANVPQTKKGSPKVGQFEQATELSLATAANTTTLTHTLTGLAFDFCVAAHAVVFDPTFHDDIDTLPEAFDDTEETAWGDGEIGTQFTTGRNWSTYFLVED